MKPHTSRVRAARFGCLAIVAGVVLGLVGCTPGVRGAVGLTVSADGQILALLEPCENRLEGARLYALDRGDPKASASREIAEWSIADDQDESDGDAASVALPALDDTRMYQFSAWSASSGQPLFGGTMNGLESLEFTAEELRVMPEGMVRWNLWFDSPTVHEGTPSEFRESACSESTYSRE